MDAAALVDRWRPSTSSCSWPSAEALAARIRHAGAIFLGAHTPEVIGDYVGGPNHVLPTGRTRPLRLGPVGLRLPEADHAARLPGRRASRALGPAAAALAPRRRAGGHARAVELRLARRRAMSERRAARIAGIELDERASCAGTRGRARAQVAIFDLLEGNSFELVDGFAGPYRVAAGAAREQPDLRGRATTAGASRPRSRCRCGRSGAWSKTTS